MVSNDDYFEREAFEIVDDAIQRALKAITLEKRNELTNTKVEGGKEIENIEWATCEDFTPALGIDLIEKFISTWKRDTSWLHCIDRMGEEEHDYDFRYKFRVRWSVPTRRKPIPRAIAAVYFTVSVSKIKPPSFPIEVFYVFEGNRLIHRPGKSRFREVWLKDIIEGKMCAMQDITF